MTRRPLSLEALEARHAPAGFIRAGLANGVLTLTGDDFANTVTLQVTTGPAGSTILLTPGAGTTVDDVNDPFAPVVGAAVPLAGPLTTITADLKGGDDSFSIDGTSDFTLSGLLTVRLGDGDNILSLGTSGRLTVGGLAVRAGDGTDTVTVAGGGGLASQVTGTATFDYGIGDSVTTLTEVNFPGPAGVRLADARVAGTSTLTATNVVVARGVRADVGGAGAELNFVGSTLGGLAARSNVVAATLDSSKVLGPVALRGRFTAQVEAVAGVVEVGDVSLAAGVFAGLLTGGSAFTAADVTVAGLQAQVQSGAIPPAVGGTFTATDVTVRGGAIASFDADGAAATVTGNLTVAGAVNGKAAFATTGPSEVRGDFRVTGGWFGDRVVTNAQFRVGRDVVLNLGDGPNQVAIGDGTATVPVGGRLSITTGRGDDQVALGNVEVAGAVAIRTGAGGDGLGVEFGSKFNGAFLADLGAGGDAITVAKDTTATAAVRFFGPATFLGGAGSDRLILGLDPGAGGTANTRAEFTAGLAHKLDGGAGINPFDGLTPTPSPSQYTGLTGVNFLNWLDPNP